MSSCTYEIMRFRSSASTVGSAIPRNWFFEIESTSTYLREMSGQSDEVARAGLLTA